MGDVVNLRNFRKQRARSEKEKRADENRVLHGTPAAERKRLRDEKHKHDKTVDGHRLEGPDAGGEGGNGATDA